MVLVPRCKQVYFTFYLVKRWNKTQSNWSQNILQCTAVIRGLRHAGSEEVYSHFWDVFSIWVFLWHFIWEMLYARIVNGSQFLKVTIHYQQYKEVLFYCSSILRNSTDNYCYNHRLHCWLFGILHLKYMVQLIKTRCLITIC